MLYRITMYLGAAAIAVALLAGCENRPPEVRQADYQAAVKRWCETLGLTFAASSCREVRGANWWHARCDVRTVENGTAPLICSPRHCEIGATG